VLVQIRYGHAHIASTSHGRLVYVGDTLRWEPARALRKGRPMTWDRTWSPEIVLLPGVWSRGCLTLTKSVGTALDLWLRNARDLRKVLELAASTL
jgi:hypothetical protein